MLATRLPPSVSKTYAATVTISHPSGIITVTAVRTPVLDRCEDGAAISMGEVGSGTVGVEMEITLMPTRVQYKVDKLWSDKKEIKLARPGENILIKFKDCAMDNVPKGFVFPIVTRSSLRTLK